MRNKIASFLATNKSLIAFNVQNIYQLKVLHQTSSTSQVPVIAQFSAKFIPYFDELFTLDTLIAKFQNDNFFFHLDHCLNEDLIKYCIDKGFASVMFDGSSLPISKNIEQTNKLYKYASKKGTLLEAEIGAISGVEDGFGEENGDYYSQHDLLMFANEARYDLLALAIGNAHGVYSSTEEIKLEKLLEAKKLIGTTPFVLHGGTGMPDEMIREAISYGVVKINISTALKMEYSKILKAYVTEAKSFDEFKFNIFLQDKLSAFYMNYMEKFS